MQPVRFHRGGDAADDRVGPINVLHPLPPFGPVLCFLKCVEDALPVPFVPDGSVVAFHLGIPLRRGRCLEGACKQLPPKCCVQVVPRPRIEEHDLITSQAEIASNAKDRFKADA